MELSLLPGKQGAAGKLLSLLLAVLILGALGLLGYVVANPQVEESFTEFFVLDFNGSADHYPSEFLVVGGNVERVIYGSGDNTEELTEPYGRVTLVINNNEGEEASYTIRLAIDGKPAQLILDGNSVAEIGPLKIDGGNEWQQEVGFAPDSLGTSQRVEFILYKDGKVYFDNPLYIWIDVFSG